MPDGDNMKIILRLWLCCAVPSPPLLSVIAAAIANGSMVEKYDSTAIECDSCPYESMVHRYYDLL